MSEGTFFSELKRRKVIRMSRIDLRFRMFSKLSDTGESEVIEQTYDDGGGGYETGIIKVDPFLDPLRSDPRFEALVQKVIGPKNQAKK